MRPATLLTLLTVVPATKVLAQRSHEAIASAHARTGVASYYDQKFVGRHTATGHVFSNKKLTAASNQFRLGSYVRVTNVRNRRSVVVLVNDRMARHNKRIIDLTRSGAEQLDFVHRGTTSVTVEMVEDEEFEENSDKLEINLEEYIAREVVEEADVVSEWY